MSIVYKSRYIAFLDILGFKNLVCQSESNQQTLNIINEALDYTSRVQNENYEGDWSMVDLGKQVSVFSDSVVISYEMTRPGAGFFVLMDLIYICNDLLGVGIPVRGGVTVGLLVHQNNKCFGPAMVEAYGIESEVAIYPRIVVDPRVIEYDLQYKGKNNTVEFEEKYIKSLIEIDERDGCIYLDYLSQYNEFNDFETYQWCICNVRNFIINSIQEFSSNQKILLKYEWLKNYYNKTILKLGDTYRQLLIS